MLLTPSMVGTADPANLDAFFIVVAAPSSGTSPGFSEFDDIPDQT